MCRSILLTLAVLALASVAAFSANQQLGSLTVIHTFTGEDGAIPVAGLTADSAGNLYGTTQIGGTFGFGTVFQLVPTSNGKLRYTVLYDFTGGADGGNP